MSEHIKQACTSDTCGGTCAACTLFVCAACGLSEGALTSECPGEVGDVRFGLWSDRADAVYDGRLDFRGGQWVEETSPHSPAFRRK